MSPCILLTASVYAGTATWNFPVYAEHYLAGASFEIRAAEDIIGGAGTPAHLIDFTPKEACPITRFV